MKVKFGQAALALALVAVTTPLVPAQGKGGGLNRALGASSKAGGARGLGSSKAGDGLARASGNLARGNMGLSKAAPGLSRAGAVRSLPTDGSTAPVESNEFATQQRILDHRMQQAEHLRGISERNGNTRLLDTATRMEASATRNFERQTGTTIQPPPTDGSTTPPTDGSTAPPTDGSVTPPADGTTTTTTPAVSSATSKSKPSGFWFKSR